MILLLDTSTPTCRLSLANSYDSADFFTIEWEAGRQLAVGLLEFIQNQLSEQNSAWSGLTGLVVFKGPGSFTGLRIGVTVMNTLAYARGIPIVGEVGEQWKTKGLARLARGESDQIVLPEYGADANITQPRK